MIFLLYNMLASSGFDTVVHCRPWALNAASYPAIFIQIEKRIECLLASSRVVLFLKRTQNNNRQLMASFRLLAYSGPDTQNTDKPEIQLMNEPESWYSLFPCPNAS